ncbi:MAG: hypothetical protein J6T25_03035 [Bacilli bacterium]|nr:hypothetical protein [Bacilli bacterium]
MNKKKSLLLLLAIPALVLGACSKGNKSENSINESSSSSAAQSTTSEVPSSSSNERASSSSIVPSSSKGNPSSSDNSKPQSSSSNPQSSSAPSGSSQQSSSSSSAPAPSTIKIPVEMGAFLKEGSYELEFDYEDSYFLTNPEDYNKNLSLLSFGAAVSTGDTISLGDFFGAAGFQDIAFYGYDTAPTADTVGYSFAHKVIEGYDVVAITVRGLNYGMEWSNNFIIGKTGNHEGFNACAIDIYQELTQYVSSKCTLNNLKIWISGYSRGGAVANVLADTIVKGESVEISANGLYAYTFEAPAGVDLNNVVAYPFVHNVINSNDIVANIPPASYGLGRCGVDYEIYDENVSTIMSAFDEKAIIPEYSPVTLGGVSYNNDTELVGHLLESVFNKEDSSAEYAVNTRSDYVDKVQPSLSHMIGYIFGLTTETRQSLVDDLKNKSYVELFSIMASQESLAAFLETYLDRDSVTYNHEQLVDDCGILSAVLYLFNEVLSLYLDSETTPVLSRLISMHYTETVYALLVNAHNKGNTIAE